jgi:hypothetical protein
MEKIKSTQIIFKDAGMVTVEEEINEVLNQYKNKDVLELHDSYGGDEVHVPKDRVQNWREKEIPKIASNVNEV